MAESLLSNLKANKVHRVNINYEIHEKYLIYFRTIDSIIGR
jgi:hypothetical protein